MTQHGKAASFRRVLWTLAALAAFPCSPLPLFAAFEDLGAGARAPGMGDAFAALADDAYSIHYNPAGLALLKRPELATSYTRHLLGLSDSSGLSSSFLGYAHPLKKAGAGAAGAAWEQFSLNSGEYQENALYLSYGRLVRGLEPGDLYGGVNAKYLRRSFGTFPEASNAMSGIAATGKPDPVLSGARSSGKIDFDLGFLYRLKRNYAVGMTVQHLLEPNVAFGSSGSDKLARSVSLGLGYRSLLSNVGAQYSTRQSPTGSRDQRMTFAAERWFPQLFVGDFAVRGSLGLGSREFKQLTLGLSYRTGRIEVDYGFIMPINTIAGTAGSHRFGLSFRFGRREEPDESVVMVLEAMRKLKAGIVPELMVLGQGLPPAQRAVLEETVARAKALQAQAQYKAALDSLSQVLTVAPGDTELLKAFGRLNFVTQYVKELPAYKTDPVQDALHQGILAYLANNDAMAVERVAFARSLNPEHKGLEGFLAQLEMATGLKRPEILAALPAQYLVQNMITRAAAALEEGRYPEAIELSLKILKEDDGNLSAWENLGTAYFALGEFENSLQSWQKARELEKSPARRSALDGYIKSIQKVMEKPKPVPAAPTQARPAPSPQEIQRLYNEGLDYYTAGQLEKAKEAFEKVLELDPAYVPAAKALRRVKEELAPR